MTTINDDAPVIVVPETKTTQLITTYSTGSFTVKNYSDKSISVEVNVIRKPSISLVTFSTPSQFSLGAGETKLVQYTCAWTISKSNIFEFDFEVSAGGFSGWKRMHRATFKYPKVAPVAPNYTISVEVGEWFQVVNSGSDAREGTEYWTAQLNTSNASKLGAALIGEARKKLNSGISKTVNDLDPAVNPNAPVINVKTA